LRRPPSSTRTSIRLQRLMFIRDCLASARAGNVIGGGDWAKDRLIPDCIKILLNIESILIRKPSSIRPWQH
ncbi:hypothetical protein QCD85_23860, partial [Paenibacillus sp. PsM32]|nr:hypothetical protein [Paenibacillus sp. PsM32]